MSAFDGQHLVGKFVAGKSQALTGQRLCKVGYKETKKTKKVADSVCVSVPVITEEQIVDAPITALIPHIRGMLEKAQDGIVRAMYESSEFKLTAVSDADLSIAKCIDWLEQEETGGRLTVEAIKEWFKQSMLVNVQAFAELKLTGKFAGDELSVKVKQVCNQYEGMFTAISGGKTQYTNAQIDFLEGALGMLEDGEDEMAEKLIGRMSKMREKNEQNKKDQENLMALLGD